MTTLLSLPIEGIRRLVTDRSAILMDIRGVEDYLVRHIRGSVSMLWEAGPGFATRARDLLPLDPPLVLVGDPGLPVDDAAEVLRGKGFDVAGMLDAGLDAWPERSDLVTTQTPSFDDVPRDLFVLHVADPGTEAETAPFRIPVERLWARFGELAGYRRLGVLAGWGVRAASAVGILERLGIPEVLFVRTRPKGDEPPMAGPGMFRIGGPA